MKYKAVYDYYITYTYTYIYYISAFSAQGGSTFSASPL
jgi:hypothetical protein